MIKIPKDWEIKKIEDISQVNPNSENLNDEFLYIDLESVIGGKLIQENIIKRKYAPSRAQRVLKKNDILFQLVRPYQQNNYIHLKEYPLQVVASTGYAQIRTDDFGYLYQYLNFSTFCNKVLEKCTGTNYPAINSNDFSKIPIAWPSKHERNKIAKILTKWDEAIELQEQLIEKLELQKKGLMQKLLKPKKDWNTTKIADLGTTYNGLSDKTKEDFGYGKYYIPYMNVYTNSIINGDFFECVKIEKNENQTKVIYGDVLFTISSETPEEVGVSSVYLGHETELYLNSFCFGFRIDDFKKLLPEFAAYYFRSIQFKKILSKLAQGVTRFNLGKESLLKENIIIPKIQEQILISKNLMNAENILKLHSQKLTLLKRQRKSLMQLLLTGTIRVKT